MGLNRESRLASLSIAGGARAATNPWWRLAVGTLALFAVVLVLVHVRALAPLDRALLAATQAYRDCDLAGLGMLAGIAFSVEVCLVLSAVASVLLWRAGWGWWSLVPWLLYLSLVSEVSFKAVVHQPVPPPQAAPGSWGCDLAYPLPLGYTPPNSFPSGYAIRLGYFATLLVVLAAWTGGPRVGIAAGVAATLVSAALAWTRVYIAWHWPMDIVGGLLLGATFALVSAGLLHARRPPARRSARPCSG